MTIRKAVVLAGLALALGAGTASAAPNAQKFGLGYQGIVAGSFLQGVSGRYWFDDKTAGELNLFYGRAGIEDTGVSMGKVDLFLATAKVLYAPIVKPNSRFYVGLEGGLGSVGAEAASLGTLHNTSVWTAEPLFGAEFNFTEFPELGLNFEVGYKWHHISHDEAGGNLDLNIDGTVVAFGAHYYF